LRSGRVCGGFTLRPACEGRFLQPRLILPPRPSLQHDSLAPTPLRPQPTGPSLRAIPPSAISSRKFVLPCSRKKPIIIGYRNPVAQASACVPSLTPCSSAFLCALRVSAVLSRAEGALFALRRCLRSDERSLRVPIRSEGICCFPSLYGVRRLDAAFPSPLSPSLDLLSLLCALCVRRLPRLSRGRGVSCLAVAPQSALIPRCPRP